MKHFYLLIALFFSAHVVQAQYLEDFNTINKGILLGPCGTNVPTSCVSSDFNGVNWTLGGNLSGIGNEGLKTISGGTLEFANVDELACFISPTIDISAVASSSISVEVTFAGGWGTDFGNVTYFVDALPGVNLPHATGCGGTATFGGGCAFADGTYTATTSGIIGNEMTVMICLDANATAEVAFVNFISVPEAGTVVPVSWNKFDATLKEEGNLLEWSTASELNNDKFEIERSVGNASDFRVIGTIEGAVNSSQELFYSYIDEDVEQGEVYFYRIKQIDLDGKNSFSRLLSVKRPMFTSFSVGPNPFKDEIKIGFADSNSKNTVTIYNAQGTVVQEIIVNGSDEVVVNTEELPAGIYYVSPNNGDYTKIVKAN